MPTAQQEMRNTELSEDGFEVLRTAVNMARNLQIQSLESLKSRLLITYPGREDLIKEALVYWGNNVRERNPNGVSRFEQKSRASPGYIA